MRVMLHRQKNGNPVYVGIPNQAAEAVLAVHPMSEAYFFWSGNGRPETAVRGWRRSLELVYEAAKLERNGKKLRAHTHMPAAHVCHREAGRRRTAERVSLLLVHHGIKITKQHYLKFDQRRQDSRCRLMHQSFFNGS
jgi:hypothetical protein